MGRVMVVTGASRGIGAAIARHAAQAGWDIAVNYHGSQANADAVVSDIRSAGGHAVAIKADMAREDEVAELFSLVDKQLGPIDALVNNAGVNHMAAIVDFDPADFDRLFAINVRGAFLAARETARRMADRGGVIVNVSSVSARTGGGPNGTLYAASKGALDMFTLGLAKELAPHGIRVCGVRPGMTETDIFDNNIGLADCASARHAECTACAPCRAVGNRRPHCLAMRSRSELRHRRDVRCGRRSVRAAAVSESH